MLLEIMLGRRSGSYIGELQLLQARKSEQSWALLKLRRSTHTAKARSLQFFLLQGETEWIDLGSPWTCCTNFTTSDSVVISEPNFDSIAFSFELETLPPSFLSNLLKISQTFSSMVELQLQIECLLFSTRLFLWMSFGSPSW